MDEHRQDECLRFVERVARSAFGTVTGCVLFGSRKDGMANHGSDIDLFMFDRSLRTAYHEHYHVEGWLFDVYAWSPTAFLHLTRLQLAQSNRYFLDALRNGTVVFDDEGIVSELRNDVASLSPYFPGDPHEWRGKRLLLTCLLNDAKSLSGRTDDMACCVDLYQAILTVRSMRSQITTGPLKVMAQHLEVHDHAYAKGLHDALARALAGNMDALIEHGEIELSAVGGAFSSRERVTLHSIP